MNKTWSTQCTLHSLGEVMACRITSKRKNAARQTAYDILQKMQCFFWGLHCKKNCR